MGALTGRGHVTVSGNAIVSGKDSVPQGWQGCGAKDDIAGIAAVDTSTAGGPACTGGKTCVDGNPKYLQSAAAGDTATYFVYGNATYQSLAALANAVMPGGNTYPSIGPVITAGACNATVNTNWGDQYRAVSPTPAGKCESYVPIIHVLGDIHISGGQGQGILLVDGDLFITGGFVFTGAVVVRGSLTLTGTGNHITGGVMAANVNVDDNSTLLGNSKISYSSCALESVMNGTAYLKPVKDRGWVDVY
jgi:hypothetical protein